MDVKKHNEQVVNYFKGVQGLVENLGKVKATVGVHSDKGEMNVKKALWNEFGTKHIPFRPFVRLYLYPKDVLEIEKEFVKNFDTMIRFHKRLGQSPLKSATSIMDNVGRVGAELQKNKIKNGNTFKPNAPSTQKIKGFDHPLYDTGELLASIDSKIERR